MKKLISAGNDIVHLDVVNSTRTCEKKLYRKILADSETDLYQLNFSFLPFDFFVWLLWSVKESAYKHLQRLTPGLVFSPKKFVVTHLQIPEDYKITGFDAPQLEDTGFANSPVKGSVTYVTTRLYFCSLLKKELVMSVVNTNEDCDGIYWGIKFTGESDPEYQSKAVREFVLNRLKGQLSNDIRINKNQYGIPVIEVTGTEISIPVSLSHHNHLVAYSFQL